MNGRFKDIPGRLLALIIALAALAVQASAGDLATLHILGFSNDGGIFAFEEYGVQDGSGFPYANRFYIDTTTDTYAASPIRARLDDETATVAQARSQARSHGEKVVPDGELDPGYQAGFNAITELSADAHRMTVNPRPVIPPADAPLEVRLEELNFPASENCHGIVEQSVGFRLLAVNVRSGSQVHLLHEDQSVPSSRGCPLGYRIGGIQTFSPSADKTVVAVMLAVETRGFEGPDYNWMAVTRPATQTN